MQPHLFYTLLANVLIIIMESLDNFMIELENQDNILKTKFFKLKELVDDISNQGFKINVDIKLRS